MILALARWVLWRAPVDDISLNLHKVMKAGNGRTKQFTCWHGKKWFANTRGRRGSKRAGWGAGARATGWERGRGRRDERKQNNPKAETDRKASRASDDDSDGSNEATVKTLPVLSFCPSPHKQTPQNHTQSNDEIDIRSGGSVLTRSLFYPLFSPPIVITYQGATCGAEMGGFTHILELQPAAQRWFDF